MSGLSRINNYGDYKKVPDKLIINKIFNEGLDSKLKNSQGSTKKKSKFENVNSSLKSITEKLKTFVTLDSDHGSRVINLYGNNTIKFAAKSNNLRNVIKDIEFLNT